MGGSFDAKVHPRRRPVAITDDRGPQESFLASRCGAGTSGRASPSLRYQHRNDVLTLIVGDSHLDCRAASPYRAQGLRCCAAGRPLTESTLCLASSPLRCHFCGGRRLALGRQSGTATGLHRILAYESMTVMRYFRHTIRLIWPHPFLLIGRVGRLVSYGIAYHTGLWFISSDRMDGNNVIRSFGDWLWDELLPLPQARAVAQRAPSSCC